MHQRFAAYCRPLPFALGAAAFLFGLHHALNWAWAWSLQTGNVFIQISVPTRLVVFHGLHLFFWILSAAGLVGLLVFGTVGRKSAKRAVKEGAHPLWIPRFRFHPLTFLLGLFLTYFGIVFLFNASVTGDDTPSGYVAFVYLNYVGIVRRSIVSIIALLVILGGVSLSTFVSFKPGLGLAAGVKAPLSLAPAAPATPSMPMLAAALASSAPTRPRAAATPARSKPVSPRSPSARAPKPAAPARASVRTAATRAAPTARPRRAPSASRSS